MLYRSVNSPLRVPDSTESWDTSTHHSVHNFPGQLLVGDNADGFRVEFFYETICEFDHVRFSMSASVCQTWDVINSVCRKIKKLRLLTIDHRIRRCAENGIHKLIAKGFANVGGRPEKTNRHALLQNTRCTWSNTRAGCNKHDAAEEWDNTKNAKCRDTSDPQLSGWVLDLFRGPVSRPADNKGVPFFARNRDGCKSVPFYERIVGDAREASSNRCYCGPGKYIQLLN